MVWARLMLEEYEDGPWDELLPQLGFPVYLVHRGLYELWTAPEDTPDEDAAFDHAARFLRESGERLRSLMGHLRNPMRLAFRYPRPLSIGQSWVGPSTTIPAELVRLAGELGLCVELEPYFEVRRSAAPDAAEPGAAPDRSGTGQKR
jgi:hypothetical protein